MNEQGRISYANESRHWLRHLGVGIVTAASYLAIAGGGALPTPELLYQAGLQTIIAMGGSFGITAATQQK